MATRATFIGIDKHLDPDIRDLTGARKDATALWALFCDTIPDIDATLILDKQATTESVRQALCEMLSKAEDKDTVIISFAGHGTHDHRLVSHNTASNNLDDSTISMEEIAGDFKKSKAKKILLILDCCFSGSAPARVLENSPIPRDPGNPLKDLSGEGRVLIAASNHDEEAYEFPGSGHGLLTYALIDVLLTGDKQIDILPAMDSVMKRVHAEAKRIGVVQTPVLFGSVKGGLILPPLIKGDRYYKEFPEERGAKISSEIGDLSTFGFPCKVLDAWSEQFKNGLNDIQLVAINDHRVLDGDSLLVVAPTSSGKTFIGEMAAARAIIQGRKSVFLFPYRALTSEKYDQFLSLYGDALGMRVIRCTGDYVDQTGPFVRGKYDLALLTYEMFLSLAVANPWVLHQVGLVVVDEAQFIADPNRGIVVELLLTYILTAHQRGICPQLIALSAVIGGTNDFDSWLGCRKLVTNERPVPLIEGVFDRSGMFQYKDSAGKVQMEQLLSPVHQRRNKPSAQDMIVPLVYKLLHENKNEKVIIFRNQRGSAEGAANYLARDLGLPPALDALADLPNHDLSTTSARLRACFEGGTAFHNTNLNREEKAVVEHVFRDPGSNVRILGATTTVAAGINTPASTVIIAEQKFVGEDGREFTVAEYKNMAGRAGRVGFQEEGKAIILADTGYQREQLFAQYVLGNLGQLSSSFDPQHIETWIIRLLAQVCRIPRDEVARLLANTYGGYLSNRVDPKWRTEMDKRLEALLERMISLELVEQEEGHVQLTLLGRACGRSALSFSSTLRLVEHLKQVDPKLLSPEWLMAVLQALQELDDCYTPMMRRGQREVSRQREAIERYGPDVVRSLQRYAPDEYGYYARCKRAAVLWDWIQGVPVEIIEQRYSTTPYQGKIGYGDVRKFADATRFHLRSTYHIITVMFMGEGPDEESIETLLKQLEVGIPEDALGLLSIPTALERGEYLSFYGMGVKTEEDFWAISEESVIKVLGEERAAALEKLRPADWGVSSNGAKNRNKRLL